MDEVGLGTASEALLSVNRCASAGVTAPCDSSPPSDSPWSSPNAAM